MFTFLPPLSSPADPCGAGLWGSLVPLGGHYWSPEECSRPTAGVMHSGAPSPWTADLEKLPGTGSAKTPLKSSQSHIYPVFSFLLLHTVSAHLHVLWFSRGLYLPPRGTCPISPALWGCFREGHTVFLSLAQRLFGCCQNPWNREAKLSHESRWPFSKRTVSTWPKRWHFLNVRITLRGNVA